ncbi:MAG: hypothetical protein ACM3QS_06850 [Bacteroidota bacterium]
MSRFIWALLAAALLAACGRTGGESPGQAPALPDLTATSPWTLRFTQSGGIMGMMRTMEIQSSGQATITDQRTKKTATVKLTQADLSQLRAAATQSSYTPVSEPTGCADCFVYRVEIDSGTGAPFAAQMDDVSLEKSGMSTLVNYLRALMETQLKSAS